MPPSQPLLATRHRHAAWAVIGACAAVVAALGVWLHGRRNTGVDAHITLWVYFHFRPRQVATDLVSLTEPGLTISVLAAVVVTAALLRRWTVVALAVFGPLAASGLTEFVLKPIIHRQLGGGTYDGITYPVGNAFPSGHETGLCSLTAVLTLLVLRTGWGAAAKTACCLLLVAWTGLGAVGLVRNYYHYPSDTLGAIAVATATVLGAALVIDAVAERRRGDAPAAAAAADRDGAAAN